MKKTSLSVLLLVVVTAAILFLIFKPVILHPNAYIFSPGGDAVKSYFNFAWYIKYDEGIKHNGINYPYGDHLQFINSHPLYVQVLKFVDRHITPIADYSVGILNLSMIISLLFAAPLLFFILRHFKLPRWYSFFIALILLFLSPQIDRISGHFEMVYAFFIPLFWYLLIKWREGKNPWLWGSLLLLSGLSGAFISAFYAAFFTIFLLALLIVEIWQHRKKFKEYRVRGLKLFLMGIAPVAVVKIFVSLTDWVNDRPDNPYGFFVYHANLKSIFLPPGSKLVELFGKILPLGFNWEGRAYVGLPVTILAFAILLSVLYYLKKRNKINWKIFFPNPSLNIYLYAATLVLLFSMCFPFKFGFSFLLDLLPPLKQFRALGRFTWTFYYVAGVFTAYYFYSFYRRLRLKKYALLAPVILFLVLYYWGLEAGVHTKRSTGRIFNKNDILESAHGPYLEKFKTAGVNPEDFQAILFLPFASTNGDKLLFQRGINAFDEAMKCSWHTAIPLLQSFSPRLSFSHALSSIQMLADSSIYKTRIDDMNQKPLLLLTTHEEMNRQEKWVIKHADPFWSDKHIILSTLDADVFNEAHRKWLNHADSVVDSMHCSGQFCTPTGNEPFIYEDFEDSPAKITFSGKGSKYLKKGETELINTQLHKEGFSGKTEISFWMYVDHRKSGMPHGRLSITDNEGKQLQYIRMNTREIHNVYDHWVRVSEIVDVKPGLNYQLKVKGDYISIDDMMIKPVDKDIFVKREDGFSLFNNFPFER